MLTWRQAPPAAAMPPPPPPPPPGARSVRSSPLSLSPSLCASEALLFFAFVASPSRIFFSPYAAEVGFRRFGKWCEALDGLSIEPRVANFCLEY
jgi:hypothetical protein